MFNNIKSLLLGISLGLPGLLLAQNLEHDHSMHHAMNMQDDRISLNMSPQMKQHQLQNMRAHLAAVQEIISQLSENKFDAASRTAHQKLGLTKEMASMCNRFENEEFKSMGINFHKSADEMGEVIAKGNMQTSLAALNKTLGYCVSCHEKFRQ